MSSLPQLFLKSSFYETDQEIQFNINAFCCSIQDFNYQNQSTFSYRTEPIQLNTTNYQNLSFRFTSPGELAYQIEITFPFCSNIDLKPDPNSNDNMILSFTIDRDKFQAASKELPSFNHSSNWLNFKIILKELSELLNEAGSLITAIELYQDESAIDFFYERFSKINALKRLKFDFVSLLNVPTKSPIPVNVETFSSNQSPSNQQSSSTPPKQDPMISALKKSIFSSIERSLKKITKN